MALCKSKQQLKSLFFKPLIFFTPLFRKSNFQLITSPYFSCKVVGEKCTSGYLYETRSIAVRAPRWIHSSLFSNLTHKVVVTPNDPKIVPAVEGHAEGKVKRKKLKGKRAVVRWLKLFRWKKKKELERMTTEEKLLYKLRKAQNKEARLMESLKKIEPPESTDATHDPEILTPEEHFYFLKMGLKCKNYVPVGRRGIFQGVILNMHLHWKKHQTLKVLVKTFTPEEVKEIAAELARLSGGIVLEIHEENTIIMYRGKNYSQPPTEIMSPKITLSRKKALDKSKYRDGLRALRKFIPRLEQDLEILATQATRKEEIKPDVAALSSEAENGSYEGPLNQWIESPNNYLRGKIAGNDELSEKDCSIESSDIMSDSEALSDIFETDSEEEAEEQVKERPLYLDEFEKFPTECGGESENFKDHLCQISAHDSRNKAVAGKDAELPDLDEVDRMFLQAGSLLRKKKRW